MKLTGAAVSECPLLAGSMSLPPRLAAAVVGTADPVVSRGGPSSKRLDLSLPRGGLKHASPRG